MYANAPEDLIHIQHYLSANCFGDHVPRSGLDLAVRELLTFAMLVALGGCEPQVKGHVAANLPGRQRPGQADRGGDPVTALHRLPPHPQRAPRGRREHVTTAPDSSGASHPERISRT